MNNLDINNVKNYKHTRKKSYIVSVSLPPLGTKVTNFLERATYVTDKNKPFVITGTVGEQWAIDINKLIKTYTFEDGTPIIESAIKLRVTTGYLNGQKPVEIIKPFKVKSSALTSNFAMHIPAKYSFPLQTAWGDTLIVNAPGVPHGIGDFIVCADKGGYPDLNDRWVVNGEIFADTYDMRAFPGMVVKKTLAYRENYEHPEFRDVDTRENNRKPLYDLQNNKVVYASTDAIGRADFVKSIYQRINREFNGILSEPKKTLGGLQCYIGKTKKTIKFTVDNERPEDKDKMYIIIQDVGDWDSAASYQLNYVGLEEAYTETYTKIKSIADKLSDGTFDIEDTCWKLYNHVEKKFKSSLVTYMVNDRFGAKFSFCFAVANKDFTKARIGVHDTFVDAYIVNDKLTSKQFGGDYRDTLKKAFAHIVLIYRQYGIN
ncbi:MAG: hypothetical protein IJ593_04725 [Lachnospiraceae bacterium]|nr:hypothetical protein [Lachnospiraceae bacterium]